MLVPFAVQSRTISSFDGTPLCVHWRGREDLPVLLLANDVGAPASAFRFVVERFSSVFCCVCWDYRGCYGSGRPVRGEAGLAVEDHAQDARAVLAAFDVTAGKPFVALGWSMGVQVLVEMLREPTVRRAAASLVCVNGVAGRRRYALPASSSLTARQGFALAHRFEPLFDAALGRGLAWDGLLPLAIRLGLLHHDIDREAFVDLARGYQQLDKRQLLALLHQLGQHDATDVLPDITCPALVVVGTEDKATPVSAAQRLAKQLPHARLELLPNGTHYAPLEMPALLNAHLEAFWLTAAERPAQQIPA